MEWYCRKNGKAVGGLEEAIFVEGREVDIDQKYFIQFTHLLSSSSLLFLFLFFFFSYSFGCGEWD
jgi:hypothetical protein